MTSMLDQGLDSATLKPGEVDANMAAALGIDIEEYLDDLRMREVRRMELIQHLDDAIRATTCARLNLQQELDTIRTERKAAEERFDVKS